MKRNKTHFILGLFSFFLLAFCCKDYHNCDKIKNGKFYYYTKKTREKTFIEWSDSLQLETDVKTGSSIMKNKIVWTSACKYDMYLNALSDSKLNDFDSIVAATPSHVEVTYVGDTFYVCIAKMNIFDKKLKFIDTIYFRK